MEYGICHLSMIPMRLEPSDRSEMTNQVLYGEPFKVVDKRKKWSRVRLVHDKYEGWIDNKQFVLVEEDDYTFVKKNPFPLSADLVQIVSTPHKEMLAIPMGSSLAVLSLLQHEFSGALLEKKASKKELISTAILYLKAPYLWGGRSPFGIDCSGFTQMVYKLNGFHLLRDASQQATQGEPLSFIEESEPGDLAFFDNAEGHITHVGIIMEDHHIIHAHGEVRIDRLDHSGIYNVSQQKHTHKLRVIKKVI